MAKTTGSKTWNKVQSSPDAQVKSWLADWPTHRTAIEQLIRERASQDPAYSWLAGQREIELMDTATQRMVSLLQELTELASEMKRKD